MSGFNHVTNPSLETATTGYTATNATLARNKPETAPGAGVWCGALTATSTAVVSVAYTVTGLSPGDQYTASMWVKVPSAATCTFYMTCATGATGKGTPWSSSAVFDRWVQVRVSFIATAGSHVVTLISDGAVPSAQPVYFDRFWVVDGPEAGPYFDGDSPGCSWNGTAHASTSTSGVFALFPSASKEPVLVGGLCLNTQAWNALALSHAGRRLPATLRGATTVVPGQSGGQFVPNRPHEFGLWTVGLWVIGAYPHGTVPAGLHHQRRLFEENIDRIQQAISVTYTPLVLYSWQADGTVRTAESTLSGLSEGPVTMGGLRGEYSIAFEILDGWWKDWLPITVVGTASAAWSNQSMILNALAGGTAPIEDAVVIVHGPAVNPMITTQSGVWVRLNGTLSSTDSWTFDCGLWTSLLNTTNNLDLVTHSGHARFLSIPPGDLLSAPALTMTATGTTTATNLTVTAARSHLSA